MNQASVVSEFAYKLTILISAFKILIIIYKVISSFGYNSCVSLACGKKLFLINCCDSLSSTATINFIYIYLSSSSCLVINEHQPDVLPHRAPRLVAARPQGTWRVPQVTEQSFIIVFNRFNMVMEKTAMTPTSSYKDEMTSYFFTRDPKSMTQGNFSVGRAAATQYIMPF